jgi:hypothetical protein
MMSSHSLLTSAELPAEGQMPLAEALTHAIQLAHAIRRLHAAGKIHGALTPGAILTSDSGVELAPAEAATPTPYSSPEQVQGDPASPQSDIFAFGAILYELATGHPPFDGDNADALRASILSAAPRPTGNPELDRLLANCLNKNPSGRWQKMQHVIVELRLLLASTRRRDTVNKPAKDWSAVLRAEMQQLESAVTERFGRQEKSMFAAFSAVREEAGANLQSACEVLQQLRQECSQLTAQVSAAEERACRAEQIFDDAYREIMQSHGALSTELGRLSGTVAAQAQGVESVRSSLSKTDDLVERVVEALDALQSMVLEHAETQAA